MEAELFKLSPSAVLAQALSFQDTTLYPAVYVLNMGVHVVPRREKESHRGQVKTDALVCSRVVTLKEGGAHSKLAGSASLGAANCPTRGRGSAVVDLRQGRVQARPRRQITYANRVDAPFELGLGFTTGSTVCV